MLKQFQLQMQFAVILHSSLNNNIIVTFYLTISHLPLPRHSRESCGHFLHSPAVEGRKTIEALPII